MSWFQLGLVKGQLGIKYISVAYNVSCYVSLSKTTVVDLVASQLNSKQQHEHDSE